MRTRIALMVPALLGGLALSAAAQETPRPGPTRLSAGGGLQMAQPVGEFDDYVGKGWGINGHLVYDLVPGGALALRLDGGFVNYGNETRRVMLSPTVGGRITVDLTTSNNILLVGVGPQLSIPARFVRPYAFGTAGVAYFVTESSLRGDRTGDSFASTNNYDDLTLALGGGGGVFVPLARGRNPVALDLGVRYQRNGRARYLREGDIRDNPDGTISFEPIESRTDLMTFHVGVSVGIGGPRGEPS